MNTPNRFEKRKQRTRKQLKACAMQLLLEKGFTDLTIQDITDCADFARGTFYVHYGDKDEIVWALVQDTMDDLVQKVLHDLREVPYKQRKYLVFKTTFEYAHAHRDLLLVLTGENGHPAFVTRLQDYVADIIRQGVESGMYQPIKKGDLPLDFITQYMTGALVRLMLWSLDTDYTPEQLAQMFYEIILREPLPDGLLSE